VLNLNWLGIAKHVAVLLNLQLLRNKLSRILTYDPEFDLDLASNDAFKSEKDVFKATIFLLVV
jgi:hypothetical protein